MPTKTTTKMIMGMDPDEFWQAQNKALNKGAVKNVTTVAKTKRNPAAEAVDDALKSPGTKSDATVLSKLGNKTVPYMVITPRNPKAT